MFKLINPFKCYSWWRKHGYSKKQSFTLLRLDAGVGLKALAESEDPVIRYEVGLAGYCHNILFRDPIPAVRRTVADYGRFLEVLANDPDETVRYEVELYRDRLIEQTKRDEKKYLYGDEVISLY